MCFLCPTNNYFVGCELWDKPLCCVYSSRSGIIYVFILQKLLSREVWHFHSLHFKKREWLQDLSSFIKLLVFQTNCTNWGYIPNMESNTKNALDTTYCPKIALNKVLLYYSSPHNSVLVDDIFQLCQEWLQKY